VFRHTGWGEHARRVDDVIGQLAASRVEAGEVADALGDLVIGARRVAADAEPADDPAVAIERHVAAEEDQPAREVAAIVIRAARCVQPTRPQITIAHHERSRIRTSKMNA
jgi:hypothetical protein